MVANQISEHRVNWESWYFLLSPWISDHSCFESFPGENNVDHTSSYETVNSSSFVQVLKQVQSSFLKESLHFECSLMAEVLFEYSLPPYSNENLEF